MEITDQKSRVEELADHVMEYVDTRWDLLVLNISEKGLGALSGIVTMLVLLVFGSIALVFTGIGTAIWLGRQMDDPMTGFFIVAGFFVVRNLPRLLDVVRRKTPAAVSTRGKILGEMKNAVSGLRRRIHEKI